MAGHNQLLCQHELAVCVKLRHPHIVSYYGASTIDGLPLQIVMELLEGNVAELIGAARGDGVDYLTVREQVDLCHDCASAIAYLHDWKPSPYVHGDIRSSNVMVTGDMRAKVGDLGTTHIMNRSFTGGCVSPNYIAPERVSQQTRSTPSSDIYSLGVTLVEIAMGELAVKTFRRRQLSRVPNERLRYLCTQMVGETPSGRPTVREVLSSLEEEKRDPEYQALNPRRAVRGHSDGQKLTLL